MPNNVSSMNYALKSVPGYTVVGVLQGNGDGPRAPPRCLDWSGKKFQMTHFTMPNNIFSMIVPDLADVGVPHRDKDRPIAPAPGSG